MLFLVLGILFAAAAAAASSSSRPSPLSSSGGTPRIAPGPTDTTPDASTPDAAPAPAQSAWARARAASGTSGGTAPSSYGSGARSSSTSTPRTPPTAPVLANASPDDAARMVTNARTVALAQSMVISWLNVPTRTGAQVGPFVAALQRARADALAEYALDHWRSPAGSPPPSTTPQSQGHAPTHTDVSSAGTNAAGHALSLVRSATLAAAQSYLDDWVRQPSRTTLDVSSAARALQQGGQDDLADALLDAWNEHERPDPIA
jgi:hypothetical protein